jgi:5-methylcytosine-specific restriction endonuclease McrA
MVRKRSYTDDQFKEAVAKARTIADVLRSLGLTTRPGNYKTVHKLVEQFGLDASHWDPDSVAREALCRARLKFTQPLDSILIEHSTYTNNPNLKRRLVRAGLLEKKCAVCGIENWCGKPISLQLDHANGIHNDNRSENIRLLCPNCHSQTPTFCRRKRKSPKLVCPVCGDSKSKVGRQCATCAAKALEKIEWPSVEELLAEIERNSYVAVAAQLGVTDNAVRRRLRTRLGCVPKKHRHIERETDGS